MTITKMNNDIQLVELEAKHAAITPYLRSADVQEIQAFSGISPAVAVAFSIAQSRPGFCILYKKKPAVIFGAAPIENRKGCIWLLGTDEIYNYPITFYRESKKILPLLMQDYNYLENYVDARNVLSLRWLKWLGFTVKDAQIMGVENKLFHHVFIGK